VSKAACAVSLLARAATRARAAEQAPARVRLRGHMTRVILTGRGRRSIEAGHPWVYADDIASGGGESGALVELCDPREQPLGWGLLSTHSKIAVRLVSRERSAPDEAFWRARLRSALALRARHGLLQARGAVRLLAGDADGFPGLVADCYAGVLVFQCGTSGAENLRALVLGLLREELPFELVAVLDRSDSTARRLEGLDKRVEWLAGEPREQVLVEEELPGAPLLRYEVDLLGGHKTGHYLDQRTNRARAAQAARGARVLDAFCYDGLFGIRAALMGAARVLCVDQSAKALERVRRNAELNGVSERIEIERADLMRDLRERETRAERYELVVVDPPAFARSKRELEGALRGYRELNRRALALVETGGLLVSASCSYNVKPGPFLDVLAAACFESGRTVVLEELSGAAPDHPVLMTLPETWYLKCATLRVR
jgi:23S rRNA (cytosine1962-C5)-methyltransferase